MYRIMLLVWSLVRGSRDHHENSDITKVHHSSHQPAGLMGTVDRNTNELSAEPCHKTDDGTQMWYYGNENPTKWRDAKTRDFSDWKFEAHYTHMLNDLMCWFFEKLHTDLAKVRNLKPSP